MEIGKISFKPNVWFGYIFISGYKDVTTKEYNKTYSDFFICVDNWNDPCIMASNFFLCTKKLPDIEAFKYHRIKVRRQ